MSIPSLVIHFKSLSLELLILGISVKDMLVGLVNSVDTEHKHASTVSSKSDNSWKDS